MTPFDKENKTTDGADDAAWERRLSRRDALKVIGVTALMAGSLTGCERKPHRKIVSQALTPEYMVPGEPLYHCSTWTDGNFPYGIVVKTAGGRPIKVDGNPAHPVNRGSSTAAMQAALLSLYDPDRLASPARGGRPISWGEADKDIVAALRGARSSVLMTRSTLGPSERAMVGKMKQILPGLKHFAYEPLSDEPRRAAWRKIYGGDGDLLPRYDKARVILSLDADFLGTDGVTLEASRQFVERRRPTPEKPEMSRLYVAEGCFSVTGGSADHRIRLRPSEMGALAKVLLNAMQGGTELAATEFAAKHSIDAATIAALIRDLRGSRGEALVVAGAHLPPRVHAAVALLNDALGAHGKTLEWSSAGSAMPVSSSDEIASTLKRGVDVLICMGVNPVYDWPGGSFAALLSKARMSVGHGLLLDETLGSCTIALPSAHNLESWNDACARPGMWTPCQPVIAPLVAARQEAESLLAWGKALSPEDEDLAECNDWHDIIRLQWGREVFPASNSPYGFQDFWEGCLRTGIVQIPVKETPVRIDAAAARSLATETSLASNESLELVIRPHHSVGDGRFANVAWLQELPDPMTKIVWDSVAAVGPAMAKTLQVKRGDMVEIACGSGRVRMPIVVQPGMADGVISVTMGHGRAKAGRWGTGTGFSVAALVGSGDSGSPLLLRGVKVTKTGETYPLVATQTNDSMEGRPLVLAGTLAQFRKDPKFVSLLRALPEDVMLHQEYAYVGYKWAMAIDLNACQGCGGCIVACQAENNGSSVGKKEVSRGRWMQWLRLDRYYVGDEANVGVLHQPVACQHCENAPCENVCPVAATTHSPEGINEMTYNRCVGTRYCSNNCPWKVRRFNFFDYTGRFSGSSKLSLAHNPNVTVRGIGVMEKCTYCIQRISEARVRAKREGRSIRGDELKTACQQACPAGAITFGNLNDPSSSVARLAKSPRAYHMLEELHTKPRTTYLVKVANPAPGTPEEARILRMQAEEGEGKA